MPLDDNTSGEPSTNITARIFPIVVLEPNSSTFKRWNVITSRRTSSKASRNKINRALHDNTHYHIFHESKAIFWTNFTFLSLTWIFSAWQPSRITCTIYFSHKTKVNLEPYHGFLAGWYLLRQDFAIGCPNLFIICHIYLEASQLKYCTSLNSFVDVDVGEWGQLSW